MSEHYLKSLFDPESIALIGASSRENSLGYIMYKRLSHGYTGKLHLVNPHHKNIGGQPCYKNINKLPDGITLAIVVTPNKSIKKIIKSCGKKGISNVVIMTRYHNTDSKNTVLDRLKILKVAKNAGVRIMGPDAACLIRTTSQLNATFSSNHIYSGKLALVSQSASISNAVIDWAEEHKIGFSSIVSYGTQLDINLSDIIDYLANDDRTNSILLQLDEVHDSRKFMSALKAAASHKPVVIMKSAHDAGSYSDAIAKTSDIRSMDDVFYAAVTRVGVDRVYTLSSLFAAAKVLSSNQRTQGGRLAIISNGRGPTLLAKDRMSHLGLEIPKLSTELLEALNKEVNISWSQSNAVLVSGDEFTAENFYKAASIMLASDEIDALSIIFSPAPLTDPIAVAESIIDVVTDKKKPILAVWMGDSSVNEGRLLLTNKMISNYRTPEAAIDAFSFLYTHFHNKQMILKVPYPLSKNIPPDIDAAKKIINKNIKQNRNVLSQTDSRLLLEAYNIPCNPSLHASTLDEAKLMAKELGYPLALKIDSPSITYKLDIDGVRLGISNESTLETEYQDMMGCAKRLRPDAKINGVLIEKMHTPKHGRELMIRILNDPAFGPVISFGAGETRSPAMRDRAIQLPPLNRRLADDLIDKTRVSILLERFRNMPAANRIKLREVLIRVSEISCDLPEVFELTINPLVLDEKQAMVTDAQVVIRNYKSQKHNFDHLAIHPYPSNWVRTIHVKNNMQVLLRPIRAEDAQAEVDFINNLSSQSKYFRFMHAVNELTPEMLSRFTKIDYDREMAFTAFANNGNEEIMVGISRYVINPDKRSCEFAIAIADDWQGLGLAHQLMLILIEHIIKERNITLIEGTVLKNNTSMDNLMNALGFTKSASPDDYDINIYRLELND